MLLLNFIYLLFCSRINSTNASNPKRIPHGIGLLDYSFGGVLVSLFDILFCSPSGFFLLFLSLLLHVNDYHRSCILIFGNVLFALIFLFLALFPRSRRITTIQVSNISTLFFFLTSIHYLALVPSSVWQNVASFILICRKIPRYFASA